MNNIFHLWIFLLNLFMKIFTETSMTILTLYLLDSKVRWKPLVFKHTCFRNFLKFWYKKVCLGSLDNHKTLFIKILRKPLFLESEPLKNPYCCLGHLKDCDYTRIYFQGSEWRAVESVDPHTSYVATLPVFTHHAALWHGVYKSIVGAQRRLPTLHLLPCCQGNIRK